MLCTCKLYLQEDPCCLEFIYRICATPVLGDNVIPHHGNIYYGDRPHHNRSIVVQTQQNDSMGP